MAAEWRAELRRGHNVRTGASSERPPLEELQTFSKMCRKLRPGNATILYSGADVQAVSIRMRSHEIFHNAHAYFTIQIRMRSDEFFHNAHAYFTVAWMWPVFIHARGRTRPD